MAGADRDGERVHAGLVDEVDRLIGIGQVHLARAVAILDPAERAELALDADALRVRGLDDAPCDLDVVLVVRRRLAVGEQRPVHHHAREPELDRVEARLRLVAVVEVEHDRDLRRRLGGRGDQVAHVVLARVGERPARDLDDHRRVDLLCRGDDALDLLHVVRVERSDAVAALGGLVEHLAQCGKGHRSLLPIAGRRILTACVSRGPT